MVAAEAAVVVVDPMPVGCGVHGVRGGVRGELDAGIHVDGEECVGEYNRSGRSNDASARLLVSPGLGV